MIDQLATRYALLPSEILTRATTFDLYILDAAVSYENYLHAKAENKVDANSYTTEELQEMMRAAKERT